MINIILGIIQLISIILLYVEWNKYTKKETIGVILDQNSEIKDTFKMDLSFKEHEHKYKDKKYTYVTDRDSPLLKVGSKKYVLYVFNKPEPIKVIDTLEPTITSEVFNELLLMKKIKALNSEQGFSDFFEKNKKYVLIGIGIIGAIFIFINGGI